MSSMLKLFYLALFLSVAICEHECADKGSKGMFQDFGLTPDEYFDSMVTPFMIRDYFRPWRYMEALNRHMKPIRAENNKFTIDLDVQDFGPHELTVKTHNGYIVVQGKHEERKDDEGFISRQFKRRYPIPSGVMSSEVISQLSSDGILTLSAPKKVEDVNEERPVPITQTRLTRKEAMEAEKACPDKKCSK